MTGGNPYVFIVGAARSGTTLLQRMLDAHAAIAVVNETYWVPRKFRERNGLTRSGLVTPALAPLLLANPRFERMGVRERDLVALARQGMAYSDLVVAIFDRYAEGRGKQLSGDKTPGYVRRILELHELLPAARFVHIVRDPRDLCVSMLDWSSGERTAGQYGTWHDDPSTSTALYWRLSVGLGRQHGTLLGPRLYHEIRYEDLVMQPPETIARLCSFLELDYDEHCVRYHEGKTRIKPGRSSKAQWLPATPGLRDWQVSLSDAQVARIEAAVGDVMLAMGYPRKYDTVDVQVEQHVARVRTTFAEHVVAAGRPLPESWSR